MRNLSTKQFLHYLFEQTEPVVASPGAAEEENETLSLAKELMGKNPHLQNAAKNLKPDNLIDMGGYVFIRLSDSFTHVKRHFSGTDGNSKIPGSKFSEKYSNEDALVDLMKKIVSQSPTKENVAEGPGVKDKWENFDTGEVIGEDSVALASDYPNANPTEVEATEPIGRNVAIPAIVASGNRVVKVSEDGSFQPVVEPEEIEAASKDADGKYAIAQNIKTVDAPKKETKEVTLVLADIGLGKTKTQDGKKIVSLVTFFPGHEYGYKSKEDYSKNGYVFLSGKESQPLSSKVPLTESRIYKELIGKTTKTLTESYFDLSRWSNMAGMNSSRRII